MTATAAGQPIKTAARIEALDEPPQRRRAAGVLSIIGATAMGVGGGIFTSTGADLWGLVDDGPHTARRIWIRRVGTG